MVDITKYMRWKESLDYNNNLLEKTVAECKGVNTSYQKYMVQNPYKLKRKELKEKKDKIIERILQLAKQGVDGYDGK
jgi:hypothetical protein